MLLLLLLRSILRGVPRGGLAGVLWGGLRGGGLQGGGGLREGGGLRVDGGLPSSVPSASSHCPLSGQSSCPRHVIVASGCSTACATSPRNHMQRVRGAVWPVPAMCRSRRVVPQWEHLREHRGPVEGPRLVAVVVDNYGASYGGAPGGAFSETSR